MVDTLLLSKAVNLLLKLLLLSGKRIRLLICLFHLLFVATDFLLELLELIINLLSFIQLVL